MEKHTNGAVASWADTEAGQAVQNRLTEERTLRAIDHLLSKIETLEKAVDGLSTMMQQGPGMVAMVGDMADEAYKDAASKGVNIDERLKNALAIAEKLTAPAMVEKLDSLVTLTDQLPGLSAMFIDMADEAYKKAAERGISVDQRLGTALEMAEKLTAPEMADKLSGLLTLSDQMPGLMAMMVDMLDEGMQGAVEQGFDAQAIIGIAGAAGTALTQAQAEPANPIGAWGLFRALSDPDRQKALGFLMNFLKHFGKNL